MTSRKNKRKALKKSVSYYQWACRLVKNCLLRKLPRPSSAFQKWPQKHGKPTFYFIKDILMQPVHWFDRLRWYAEHYTKTRTLQLHVCPGWWNRCHKFFKKFFYQPTLGFHITSNNLTTLKSLKLKNHWLITVQSNKKNTKNLLCVSHYK